eukprot:TRINITY_DN1193_c0_g1_i1.p1 TRINITY_DN1193_c0_g1~~TRINITY_DN1193_c0_g1_i1.p1  ORF type:complete len:170 (-),score=41.04 TRINITY_DN1193_c0_g1_i1:193-702(-)
MVIISPEKQSQYLHEILSIQHFLNNEENPSLNVDVLQNQEVLEPDAKEIINYNWALYNQIKEGVENLDLSVLDLNDLERLCRYRLSEKSIKNNILNNKGFFSKIDKWVIVPGPSLALRHQTNTRIIVTISSNYSQLNDNINATTAITITTVNNFQLPSLQDLLHSLTLS